MVQNPHLTLQELIVPESEVGVATGGEWQQGHGDGSGFVEEDYAGYGYEGTGEESYDKTEYRAEYLYEEVSGCHWLLADGNTWSYICDGS